MPYDNTWKSFNKMKGSTDNLVPISVPFTSGQLVLASLVLFSKIAPAIASNTY